MVIVHLDGGLGNQMFQYAFGRMISEKYSYLLKLDVSALFEYRKYELDIFGIKTEIATKSDLLFFDRRNLSKVQKLVFRLRNLFFKIVYLYENEGQLNMNLPPNLPTHTFVKGHWQSESYFKEIEAIIRKDFTFPALTGESNINMGYSIEGGNSVSVHIRRGDYLLPQNNAVHGLLPLCYYQEAIQYLEAKIDNPVFYVFSDDPEWVTENLHVEAEIHYVKGNENDRSFVDMQLMSCCKHNIIANSSFSWWGAWLNNNLEKIVVAPGQWFAQPEKNDLHKNIVPKEWIRI